MLECYVIEGVGCFWLLPSSLHSENFQRTSNQPPAASPANDLDSMRSSDLEYANRY